MLPLDPLGRMGQGKTVSPDGFEIHYQYLRSRTISMNEM
jgi:hypothetical protein